MKRIFLFTVFAVAAMTRLAAQDFGVSAFSDNRMPMKSTVYTGPKAPLIGYGVDVAWWNPDKGFPIFGLVSIGFQAGLPQKIETVDYLTASGTKHADIIAHSWGIRTRYAWEIVQPMQHLSVSLGFGSTFFHERMEARPDSPLTGTDYIEDSRGIYYNATGNNDERFISLMTDFLATGTYEFPQFNVWGQLGFSYGLEGYGVPYSKGIIVGAGVFVPILRR